MRNIAIAGLLVALTGCGGGENAGTAGGGNESAAPGDIVSTGGEWQVLFDGSSLDGWTLVGDANWEIDGDTVGANQSSEGSFLVTAGQYRDFDLSLEFWVDVPANSGVFVRCAEPGNIGAETCYEVNIYDTRPDPTYRTGSVVNFVAPAEMVSTGGRWNRYEISLQGNRLSATLNGVEMFDFEDDTYDVGHIGLQYGSGTVIFRNVQVRTP